MNTLGSIIHWSFFPCGIYYRSIGPWFPMISYVLVPIYVNLLLFNVSTSCDGKGSCYWTTDISSENDFIADLISMISIISWCQEILICDSYLIPAKELH